MEMEKLNGCVCEAIAPPRTRQQRRLQLGRWSWKSSKQLGAQQKTKEVTDAAVKVVVYYISNYIQSSYKSHNQPHRQANLGHHTDQDKYHGLLRFSFSTTTCAMKETCKMYKVHASTSYLVRSA